MTNDAERVSAIVARLRGNALVTYLDNGLIATVPPSNAALLIEAADIIEDQSKALAEARVAAIIECLKIANAQADDDELHWRASGRDEEARSHYLWAMQTAQDIAKAIRALLTPTPENPNG